MSRPNSFRQSGRDQAGVETSEIREPSNPETPGPWKDSPKVRSAAQIHDERFRECVSLQAQYIYDTFGKFPGTVPSMFLIMYLQAHHLDLDFYDKFYKPGSYLKTHAMHMANWHSGDQG